MNNIRAELTDKENEIDEQLRLKQQELEQNRDLISTEDINSKKFLINVLETRLARQLRYNKEFYANAEKKIVKDERLLKFML